MNSSGNWVLQVDPVVCKFLERIPRRDAERILIVINNLASDPFYGDIQKMGGEKNVWRRRMGSYRVLYEVVSRELVIHVFRAERRASKTYK